MTNKHQKAKLRMLIVIAIIWDRIGYTQTINTAPDPSKMASALMVSI